MTDPTPEKQPRKTFSELMTYRPRINRTQNAGLKWTLIITIALMAIAFIAAIIILLPYFKLLGF